MRGADVKKARLRNRKRLLGRAAAFTGSER